MIYTTQHKYIRQVVTILLCIGLVISNYTFAQPSCFYSRHALRVKATSQTESTSQALETSLTGTDAPSKSSSAGKVKAALEGFIDAVGAGERILFEFGEGHGFPQRGVYDSNRRRWEEKLNSFYDKIIGLSYAIPVQYNPRRIDSSYSLSTHLQYLSGNGYDGVASFYDPQACRQGPPEDYKGVVTVSFKLKGKNFVITIADNGMGESAANSDRKEVLMNANLSFYTGGAGLSLDEIKRLARKSSVGFMPYKSSAEIRRTETVLTIPIKRLVLKENPLPAPSLQPVDADRYFRPKTSSAGIIADEEYIRGSGYNVIGGSEDKELSERLTYLTGINALAHDPEVYSPLRDMGQHEEISIEFASAAAHQIKEAAARLKSRGKDKIRILVIGSATGIDALTAFHHAKFVNKIKSVEVGAIDIQEEGVSSTRFNFMLRLPGSRFEGEALQFAKEGFENDNIIVRRVIEGEELDGLEGKYDLILFHAPDAVGPGRADDTRVHMDQFVFKAILENARERLSDDGVVLVKNQRSILNADPNHGRYGRLIPAGFDVSFAEPEEMSLGAILAPPMPTSWAIFKLTLSPHRLPKSGSLKPSVEIKRSVDREKAISQSA